LKFLNLKFVKIY